ncbi:putative quorum-sensing-regulated virulence factor [Acinetobacter sp. HR7]|uniref:putative quorum-sensing-regulated virulence factor n=1 Tax=Acinetobacter sp. HR7 TaxID=1509403 RepID=UPI000538709F|nr:DUF3820 family protein [Acinetobacter sp. HR7]KGT48405.1 hypothetical protein GW12_05560 [Acinetobacter sp. HR7]
MKAIILDTETNTINGFPIEIAYAPVIFDQGHLFFKSDLVIDQFYSCPEPISYGAMATHHILESDLQGKPCYDTFQLPEDVDCLIGHNINYDIEAIRKCRTDVPEKSICTLALARFTWPELETHTLSALFYFVSSDKIKARDYLRNAHSAKYDIWFTYIILKNICIKLGIKDMNSLYILSEQVRTPSMMPFGKHKGTALKELPKDYIQWMLTTEIDPYLRKALEAVA